MPDERVREFTTGATRSADINRDDPEGFLSPLALDRYSEYMHKNRRQPDGSFRDSDNWQKGLPLTSYMKAIWRHMLHLWTRHRGYPVRDEMAGKDIEEDLCALLFNVQGYLHEVVKARLATDVAQIAHAAQPAKTLDFVDILRGGPFGTALGAAFPPAQNRRG